MTILYPYSRCNATSTNKVDLYFFAKNLLFAFILQPHRIGIHV